MNSCWKTNREAELFLSWDVLFSLPLPYPELWYCDKSPIMHAFLMTLQSKSMLTLSFFQNTFWTAVFFLLECLAKPNSSQFSLTLISSLKVSSMEFSWISISVTRRIEMGAMKHEPASWPFKNNFKVFICIFERQTYIETGGDREKSSGYLLVHSPK